MPDVPLSIPDEALPFILLQRTGLQRLNFRFLRKLGVAYHPRICTWECRWRRAAIAADFAASINGDYQQIRGFLPAAAGTILDIGCGVAGIDAALNRHYVAQPPQFRLLDKSAVSSEIYYDFHSEAAFYNSLGAAQAVLKHNGVAAAAVKCFEATEDNRIPLADGSVNLVISLISWGFHYPVTVYLQEVMRVLAPGGSLIMDVRRDSSGLDDLRGAFANLAIIAEQSKFLRVCGQR